MASRKRARTSSTGSGSSGSTAAALVELDGGEPCPSGLVKLWRSGRLTDTTVEVEGRSFAAHKAVLAAQCDYFNRHYDHEHMRDAGHPKLIEHVTAAAFEPLLAFLYEGACTFDESLLAPVLRAANYLNVAPLEKAAIAALKERLSPSNALTAWTWGEELELPELAEAAKETALCGFDEVEKIEEATLSQMQTLVADDRLTAKSEEAVFSAVARFAEAKQPAEAELHDLLRTVRFPLMSQDFLQQTVRDWPLLQTMSGQKLLFDMMAPLVGGPAQPRCGIAQRLCFIDSEKQVRLYAPQTKKWTTCPPMRSEHLFPAAAMLDGKVYIIGGGGTANVEVFDPQSLTWSAGAPLIESRNEHTAAAAGGKLFVFGGDNSQDGEAFDPQTGAWTAVANPPLHFRAGAKAVELRGQIYLAGGFYVDDGPDGAEYAASLDVYDPQTNTWAAGPPMRVARAYHGMAVLGDKIYVAGGACEGGVSSDSVEVFDLETQSWVDLAPLSPARETFVLTALRGELFAVGGYTPSTGAMYDIMAYDIQHNRWMEHDGPPPDAPTALGGVWACVAL